MKGARVTQQAVVQAINAEKRKNAHFVDLAFANYAFDTTGSIALVATMAQGSSQSQRIGKKAQYKSFQLRGSANANSVGGVNDCAILLVYDRDPTGSLPAITDILNTVSTRSMNNDANSDRFHIIRRWDFILIGNTTTLSTGKEARTIDEYVKFKFPVQFKAAGTGAIADIAKGAVYLVTVGNNAAGTSAAELGVGIRTRFIDLDG